MQGGGKAIETFIHYQSLVGDGNIIITWHRGFLKK